MTKGHKQRIWWVKKHVCFSYDLASATHNVECESSNCILIPQSPFSIVLTKRFRSTFFSSQFSYVYTQHYCNCGSNCIFQVCKFLEVSKLSFSREYGPKLKEGYVMVKHLTKPSDNDNVGCFPCQWFGCCSNKWTKVVEFQSAASTFLIIYQFIAV